MTNQFPQIDQTEIVTLFLEVEIGKGVHIEIEAEASVHAIAFDGDLTWEIIGWRLGEQTPIFSQFEKPLEAAFALAAASEDNQTYIDTVIRERVGPLPDPNRQHRLLMSELL